MFKDFLSSLFDPLVRIDRGRQKALGDPALPAELHDFYARPLPKAQTNLNTLKIVSIDFETTGLDFAKDTVLSIGGVSIVNGNIAFETAFHTLLKSDAPINGATAVINQITPEQLQQGADPHEAMLQLMDRLSGGVVLTHCAVIESSFLRASLQIPAKFPLPMYFLDTLQLERTLLHSATNEDVRLSQIRQRRGFPAYEAHNALADSLATAEVFLAQLKDLFGHDKPLLGPVYRRSH